MRVFWVMTEPSCADPAWIMPVTELRPGVSPEGACWPEDFICYTNADELVKVATKLQANLAAKQIEYAAVEKTLKVLGVSHDEYFEKLKEAKNG